MRLPDRDDHRRFCEVDGWERTADKPGRRVKKHEVWSKRLGDGSLLRTVLSKGSGQYGRSLFASILSRQLKASQEQFWAAVESGSPAQRPEDRPTAKPSQTMPLWLHERLKRDLGYTDDQLANMGREEAQRRFDESERAPPPS